MTKYEATTFETPTITPEEAEALQAHNATLDLTGDKPVIEVERHEEHIEDLRAARETRAQHRLTQLGVVPYYDHV